MTNARFARMTAFVAALLLGAVAALPAAASCLAVAGPQPPARLVPVSFGSAAVPNTVDLTFLGHSSFLVATPEQVTAITDYNGYIRAATPPDIVTMNHAHSSHYTDTIEPGVSHVLRGWDSGEGIPQHNVSLRDLRVRNVPTNIRDAFVGTEFAGNSIFIFETVGLCIAHLGHLHHQLQPEHLAQIGIVDVLLAPIDDGYTMAQAGMVEVIETLRPSVVIPMHYSGPWLLGSFAAMMQQRGWVVREHDGASVRLSRAELPRRTVLVLPSERF
jgi:L-ascorbate metabolism protein UlaG (beta-lactamase superfamily)